MQVYTVLHKTNRHIHMFNDTYPMNIHNKRADMHTHTHTLVSLRLFPMILLIVLTGYSVCKSLLLQVCIYVFSSEYQI